MSRRVSNLHSKTAAEAPGAMSERLPLFCFLAGRQFKNGSDYKAAPDPTWPRSPETHRQGDYAIRWLPAPRPINVRMLMTDW